MAMSALTLCATWGGTSHIKDLNPSASKTYVASATDYTYSPGTVVAYATSEIFTVNERSGQITFNDCNTGGSGVFTYSIYEYPFNPANPSKGFVRLITDACPKATVPLNPEKYYEIVINDPVLNSNRSVNLQFNGNDKAQTISRITSDVSWYNAAGTLVGTGPNFNPVPGIITNTNTPGDWTFYASCGPITNCREEVHFIIDPIPTGSATGENVTCSEQETNIRLSSVDRFGSPVPVGSVSYTWSATITVGDPSNVSITRSSCTSGCSEVIRETVTNTGTTTAFVDFAITPKGGNCLGETFHYTLAVEPLPDFTVQHTNSVICPSDNPQISPIQIVTNNASAISGLQYKWTRTNTGNLPVLPGAVPASGTGSASGFTISGALFSTMPRTLQTTEITIEAQVNGHTCVAKTISITVGDEQAPLITCPPPPATPGECSTDIPPRATDYNTLVALGGVASDNCTNPPKVVHVGDVLLSGTMCNGVIRRTYRATDYAGNYTECSQDFTINDDSDPTFVNTPPESLDRCVNSITEAVFDSETIDINPERPDWYQLTDADKALLDNITFTDNCGATLYWSLLDHSNNPVRDEDSDTLSDETGTVSSHLIVLDGAPGGDVVYYFKYWLVDACTNSSEARVVVITIKPRPNIIKMN